MITNQHNSTSNFYAKPKNNLTQQCGAQCFKNRRQNVRLPELQHPRTHDGAVAVGAVVGAHAERHQEGDEKGGPHDVLEGRLPAGRIVDEHVSKI